MTVPKPSQEPQGAVVMTWPRMERTARWTWPLPPQMSQRSGWLPSRQQDPSQVGQVTAVSTSSFLLTPKTASRRSIRTLISASWPRRTRDAGPRLAAAGAEEGLEDVLEGEALAGVAAAAEAVVGAVLVAGGVIDPALLRIGEHLVGVGDGLEPVRGVVPGVHVRVQGAGQLAVGLLDLLPRGFAGDSKNVVVAAQSSYLFLVVLPVVRGKKSRVGPGPVTGPGSSKGSGPPLGRRPWWWDSPSGWAQGRRPWRWRPDRSRWPPPRPRRVRRRGFPGRC